MSAELKTTDKIMGCHSSDINPKQFITPIPAGMKKNPRFFTKISAHPSTHFSFTIPDERDRKSRIIPMMLAGMGMWVTQTINSPSPRNKKRMHN